MQSIDKYKNDYYFAPMKKITETYSNINLSSQLNWWWWSMLCGKSR
jgi:hypothetical protein